MNAIIEYVKLTPSDTNPENVLKLTIDYDIGGMNYFTYKQKARGYYMSCIPMKVNDEKTSSGRGYTCESAIVGKGLNMLLKEVGRGSKKAEQEAIEIAKRNRMTLIVATLNKYNLTLAEEVI